MSAFNRKGTCDSVIVDAIDGSYAIVGSVCIEVISQAYCVFVTISTDLVQLEFL